MVGRHQDKVETVEAVIPATLEFVHFFVHFCIINREQLFDITVKFCFMKSMKNIPFMERLFILENNLISME